MSEPGDLATNTGKDNLQPLKEAKAEIEALKEKFDVFEFAFPRLIRENKKQEEELDELNQKLETSPYMLVLIDGNDIKYPATYFEYGEDGGDAAVQSLIRGIRHHMREFFEVRPDIQIVVQVLADVFKLSDSCVRSGLMNNAWTLMQFMRGFNKVNSLSDFVDSGPEKSGLNSKIIDRLLLYRPNVHCIEIFLGTYENEVFERAFHDVEPNERKYQRLHLLTSRNNRRQLPASAGGFKTICFEDLIKRPKPSVDKDSADN